MKRRIVIVLAWIVALGIAGYGGWRIAIGWRPAPARFALQGIDLGLDPAPIDWGSVRAAGADFGYIVATAGTRRRDQRFEENWQALPEAGMRRGAVHLYSLCEGGAAQADAFNTVVPASADALPAAVDIALRPDCDPRPDADALATEVARFVARVETHTGKPVVLRIAADVERRFALSTKVDRPLWEMRNFIEPHYGARPWRLWRASDMHRIRGAEDAVNWDVVAS